MHGTRNPAFGSSRYSAALAGGLALWLAACSSGQPSHAVEPIKVNAVLPTRQVFHARVAAFGQLAADSRTALTLSLPQAGEVLATDVVAGQRVARGAALLKFATAPATRSTYLQARSALQAARAELAHAQHLHAENLATNTQLDAARKALADAEAVLAAQAKLGGAETVTVLRAPAAGVVITLAVHRGERVAAGTALMQFTPAAALVAQLGVDPAAAAQLRIGMPVTLHPVYAAHGTPALRGTLAMVGAAVDTQTHLINVVATLAAPTALPAGDALAASIATASIKAWAVPRDALQSDAHGKYVYQIEHGKAQRVNVRVVAPDGSPIGVAGALDSHAPVITLGSYEVSEGEPVRAAAPASAASGATAE